MAPFSRVPLGWSRVAYSSAVDNVPVRGAVKIVPPVGGSILTAPACWRVWTAVEKPADREDPRRRSGRAWCSDGDRLGCSTMAGDGPGRD